MHNKTHHGENYVALDQREKLVLVMGNEVRELSPAILKRADAIVEIPMRGKKESLNIAVAFGIAAYWFLFGFGELKRLLT